MDAVSYNNTLILRDATPALLEQAAADNHRELFCLNAVCQGGEVCMKGGLTWIWAGPDSTLMIAFPSLAEKNAGALLDEMMAWCRAHPSKGAGCWSFDPPQPADLGIRLLARGFQPGWQPCWMALDLEAMITGHPSPPGLQISADNDTATHHLTDLPYSGDKGMVPHALLRAETGLIQRFIATLDGRIVGQSAVFFSTGASGTAGIYDVGVIPEARGQGIGKAVTLAACRYAQQKGYRYAVLNAAARHLYEQIGFTWISNGLSWELNNRKFIDDPPSQEETALAEATGRGDREGLGRIGNRLSSGELNTPLTNGMTLMQLAAHCRQPTSAEWLVEHGVRYTALDAWDLRWTDRAAALLATQPQEIDRKYGEQELTLLHIAAERNDIALAQLALDARPDLTIKDKTHDGTPFGWAYYLQRKEIAELIKNHR